ncbi:MAG: GAF domain-containing protein, partial [Desulfobacterales bacterium]|nr:GAF domain-containing protein [Desulfobacterales bacterium]
FSFYALTHCAIYSFCAGEPLDTTLEKFKNFYLIMTKLKQFNTIPVFEFWYQLVLNLTLETPDIFSIKGSICDENNIMPKLIAANEITSIGMCNVGKVFLYYFYGNYEEAIVEARKGEAYLPGLLGKYLLPFYYFYYSLALLAHYPKATAEEQQQYIESVELFQTKMALWAKFAPMNCEHKYVLVEAEKSRLTGTFEETIRLYDKAIVLSMKHGFLQDEALSNELAARYCSDKGFEKFALSYLREAFYKYEMWGATVKCDLLKRNNPKFRYDLTVWKDGEVKPSFKSSTIVESLIRPSSIIDTAAVIKSAQAIAIETNYQHLIQKIIEIIYQNAGAQRALMILKSEKKRIIEASIGVRSTQSEIVHGNSFEEFKEIAHSIVNYVLRTGEPVVIDNVAKDDRFITDPYIQTFYPKSILCVPIIYKQDILGVVYLENNINAYAFTKDQIQVIIILLAQAAISIENARLFEKHSKAEYELKQYADHLQDMVEERTEALKESETKLMAIFKGIPVPTYIWQKKEDDLVLMDFNDSALQISKGFIANWIGSKASVLHHDNQTILNDLMRCYDQKNIFETEMLYTLKSTGEEKYLIVKYAYIPPDLVLVHTEDVTEKKKAEAELTKRSQELEYVNKELESFSYSVSHDLRAPIRHMEGFTNLLSKELGTTINPNVSHYLEVIIKKKKKMSILIDSLLHFSRVSR